MASHHTQKSKFLATDSQTRPTGDFLSSAPASLLFCSHAALLSSPQNINTCGLFQCCSSIPLCQKFVLLQLLFRSLFKSHLRKEARLCYLKWGPPSTCSFIPLPFLIFLLRANHYQKPYICLLSSSTVRMKPHENTKSNASPHYQSLQEYHGTCSNTCKWINIMSLQVSWTMPNGKTNYFGGYASDNAISQSG